MKKIFLFLSVLAISGIFISFTSSCKKSQPHAAKTYAYADTFHLHYQLIGDLKNGWSPETHLPAWVPNSGTGTSEVAGQVNCNFTPYATFGSNGVVSVYVPCNRYFMSQMAAAGITVSDSVQMIVYDNYKNAIWFKEISTGELQTGPTRINVWAEFDIIGGSGKFVGATGHVTQDGYFNPSDTSVSEIGLRGSITY